MNENGISESYGVLWGEKKDTLETNKKKRCRRRRRHIFLPSIVFTIDLHSHEIMQKKLIPSAHIDLVIHKIISPQTLVLSPRIA